MLGKDAICRCLSVNQAKAWNAHKKSGMSEKNIRLALKYGTRWRLKTLKRIDTCSKIVLTRLNSSSSILQPEALSYIPRKRPSPRMPSFLFDSECNSFTKLYAPPEDTIRLTLSPEPVLNNQNNQPAVLSPYPDLLPVIPKQQQIIENILSAQKSLEIEKDRFEQHILVVQNLKKIEADLELYVNSPFSSVCGFDFGKCLEERKGLVTKINLYENSGRGRKRIPLSL